MAGPISTDPNFLDFMAKEKAKADAAAAAKANADVFGRMKSEADEYELAQHEAEKQAKVDASIRDKAANTGALSTDLTVAETARLAELAKKSPKGGGHAEILGNTPRLDDGKASVDDSRGVRDWLKSRLNPGGQGPLVIPGGMRTLRSGSSTTQEQRTSAKFDPKLLPQVEAQNKRRAGELADTLRDSNIISGEKQAVLDEEKKRLLKAQAQEQVDLDKARVRADEAAALARDARESLQKFRADPNAYWTELGGGAIVMALAAGASAFATGYSQGKVPDVVGKMIQQGINVSIQAQKIELEKRLKNAGLTAQEQRDALKEYDRNKGNMAALAKNVLKTRLDSLAIDESDISLKDRYNTQILNLDRDLLGKKNDSREKVVKTRSSTSSYRQQYIAPKVVMPKGSGGGKPDKKAERLVLDKVGALAGVIKLKKAFNELNPNALSGGLGGEQTSKYRTLLDTTAADYLKSISGASATDAEYGRLKGTLDGELGLRQRSKRIGNFKMDNHIDKAASSIARDVHGNPELYKQVPPAYRPYVDRALAKIIKR